MHSEIRSLLQDINNKVNNVLLADFTNFTLLSILHNSLNALNNQLNIMSSKIIINNDKKINIKSEGKIDQPFQELPIKNYKMDESSDSSEETPNNNTPQGNIEIKPYEKWSIYDPEYYFLSLIHI